MTMDAKNSAIQNLAAFDVHAHVGNYRKGRHKLVERCMSASAEEVVQRAKAARTEMTVFSHIEALLPPGKANVIRANRAAARIAESQKALRFWAVLNPRQADTFSQARDLLAHPKCAGLKIHPELHLYPISKHGAKIIAFAAEFNAIVLTHSGEAQSLPPDFLPFMNAHPNVTLILAHLGCSADDNPTRQVQTVEASKHGNIYVDTSSSMSILPNLIEWAVGKIGSERILYGTDSPLYFAPMQRSRINYAAVSDKAKRLILRENAVRIFALNRGTK